VKGEGKAAHQGLTPWYIRWSWWLWLGFWTAVGFGIRLASVLGRPNRVPLGDAQYYHNAANLLVAGKGFINPFLYHQYHQVAQTASFPPGFVFVLAAAAVVGFKSFFAQRIWCCIIGASAVTVCGLTGREIAGRRVGLIAAALIAVYPNVWMSDELGLSETLTPLLVAFVLLMAYRFWHRPGLGTVLWFGLSIGVAAIARDELALLGLFVFVPMVLMAKSLTWRRRATFVVVGGLAGLLVVAPWVGYNFSRFKDPVYISSGLGITLASANCTPTYYGALEGYWDFNCALKAPLNRHVDESVQASQDQSYAMHFIRSHESRLVTVEGVREARAFGFWRPIQQIQLDSFFETRPYRWALVGLGMYYGMLALSVAGVVLLRLRRIPVLPLLAVGLQVVVSVALTFGNTRYRTPFEVSLVLLSAVTLDWMWSRLRRRGRQEDVGTPEGEELASVAVADESAPDPSDAADPADEPLSASAGLRSPTG
jgi:4-amino-4-deoxy-L-arabinose transferase-like glycosyltransferase